MRRHVETIIVAIVTAGMIGMLSHYVSAQATAAVLVDQLETHKARIGIVETTLQAVALTQQRLSATQEMLVRMNEKHDDDMRELRSERRAHE